ncbi:MAG: DUF5752 family protein [Candidatus Aminicenantia bacterium]
MDRNFQFYSRLNLVELLGISAKNIIELLQGIKTVPGTSIYYHTHRFLQQHHYLSPEPPNDFAFWITNSLGLDSLGERMASIDTVKFGKIRELRDKFIEILEDYIKNRNFRNVECPEGEEFHFMSCRTFIFKTPYVAETPDEFIEIVEKISINSIYYHIFESRLRLEKGEDDFSNWFESLGFKEIARELSSFDPYTITLEGLRRKIIETVRNHLKERKR